MGYTHYWYRKDKEINPSLFLAIGLDFRKLLPELERLGVFLAGGDGEGKPVIDTNLVWFNGVRSCRHPRDYELGITWPSDGAKGIANPWTEDVRRKPWFAGATLEKRTCSGDCSHETCWFPRVIPGNHHNYFGYHPTEEKGSGWQFDFCKTAYKPYDLAVTAFLIIAKEHLRKALWIASDGETQHWADGRLICHGVLRYGLGFELDRAK